MICLTGFRTRARGLDRTSCSLIFMIRRDFLLDFWISKSQLLEKITGSSSQSYRWDRSGAILSYWSSYDQYINIPVYIHMPHIIWPINSTNESNQVWLVWIQSNKKKTILPTIKQMMPTMKAIITLTPTAFSTDSLFWLYQS